MAALLHVDAYSLPAENFAANVVELRYAGQDSDAEPAAKRQRAEQQPSSDTAAGTATQPAQRCLKVAASAMLLARASEKFKRALDPDWSGTTKVLVLDIEEGQLEVYSHLLHNLHMPATPKPWLPGGLYELVALLEVADKEMAASTLLGCAKALLDKAEGLSQDDAEAVLCCGLHTATDDEEGSAALAALREATLTRLLVLLSPLLVLGSTRLKADSEETVLAVVLAWLQHNTDQVSEEERKVRAVQLLGHVRWGLVRPYIAAIAWQCSDLLRAFDPHRQLLCCLLLARQMPDQPGWWTDLKTQHPRNWWQARSSSPGASAATFTFHLEVSS
ncbi:hypothetical protein N2152v2_000106 [Parachlorella kessleri]